MNLLWFVLRSSRGTLLFSALAGAIGGVTGIALIALVQMELARESYRPGVMVWAFVALCFVSALARIIGQVGMIRLGQGAVAELGLRLVQRALQLPLRTFESIDASALLAVLTEDIVLIANAMVGIAHLCINIPIVIACFVYIGWLSPLVLVCGGIFAAIAIAVSVFLSERGVHGLRRARAQQDVLVGHFRTLIDGFRELKLHDGRRTAYLDELLEPTVSRVRNAMLRGLNLFAIIEGWNQLALFGFIGILLFVVPGWEPISRPTLVAAVLVVLYLMSPFDVILTWLPILGRARVSLLKVQAMMPTLKQRADEAAGRLVSSKRLALRDQISLKSVSFTYRDGHDTLGFTLESIDLTLRRGEIVILAGGNGSGKTTLVKLLSGLYRPEKGTIRLDGRVIGDEDREAYRQLFSVAFADGYVFPDFLGLQGDAIDARANDGLERLRLAPQVSLQGRSFSTMDLSQGQRRRLALLGILLEDRPVCILDEWAANQDLAFKRVFYDKLLPELRSAGKAVLVISHDENHFHVGDRVVRLQDGRLLDESPLEIDSARA
jgi:putative ATP-binding cassette transporter